MVTLILACVVVFILLWSIQRPKNFPPGPPSIPILGSIPFLELKNFHLFANKLREKYGPVIGMKFGNRNVVVVCGKKEVEETLRRDEFQGRPVFDLNTQGVIFSDGEFWTQQRRFTLRHLRDFGFGKNTIEDVILGEVDDFFLTYFDNSDTVQVSGLFNASAVNVLWAMMGGKRYPHDDPEFRLLLDCLQKRFRSGSAAGNFKNRHPFLSKLLPFLKPVREENVTDQLLKNFLEKAFKEHRQTKDGEPRDFIDVYLNELDNNKELHPSFSERTLRNVCSEFFSAGAESVGNSLGFSLLYCILYPEWQDKLYEEIVSVIGKEKRPSLSDKKWLHKVEAFMTEVSRCNTIACFSVPHRCVADTTLNGYSIPKDTMVLISLYASLSDKEYWGDPENFRPERFMNAQGEFVKDKGVPVFGGGKRICPGESLARSILFLFFTSIIQRYRIELPAGHAKPSDVPLSGFTQAPQPFEMVVKRRH